MATTHLHRDTGSRRTRSPFVAAAIVLAVYLAAYLAFAGFVHVLGSPDAIASAVVAAQPNPSAPGAAPND